MRRTIFLAGVLPFMSAFLGGVLAFSLVAAPQATAQSSQPQEVRASAFTLVGTDGTVLARLAPGRNGFGRLDLYDPSGTRRSAIAANGQIEVYDDDGETPVFRAGRNDGPGASTVNGVQLGPGGSIGILAPLP
jgi:hypothetical protein